MQFARQIKQFMGLFSPLFYLYLNHILMISVIFVLKEKWKMCFRCLHIYVGGVARRIRKILCMSPYLIAEILIQPWKSVLADFLVSYNWFIFMWTILIHCSLAFFFFLHLKTVKVKAVKAMMIRRLRLLGNQKDFHFKKDDSLHLYFMRTYLHKTLRSFKKGKILWKPDLYLIKSTF